MGIADIRVERIGLPRTRRTPTSPVKIAAAIAAMGALLMVFAIQRLPGAERIDVPEPVIPESKFDAAVSSFPKTDRDPVRLIETVRVASTEPVPVKTETIRPDPAPAVPKLVALPEDALDETGTEPKYSKRVKKQRIASGDICTRHGKRKVMIRGGKSWRCR